jgi:hypothetical protein
MLLLLLVLLVERCAFPDAVECWAWGTAYMASRGGNCARFPDFVDSASDLLTRLQREYARGQERYRAEQERYRAERERER